MNKDKVLRRDLEQGRGHVRVRRKRGEGKRREVEDATLRRGGQRRGGEHDTEERAARRNYVTRSGERRIGVEESGGTRAGESSARW